MTKFDETSPRRVLPRWRVAHDSAAKAEHVPVPSSAAAEPVDPSLVLAEVVTAWEEQPCLGTALDLVSTAHLLHEFDLAQDAARFIQAQSDELPDMALAVARAVQRRQHHLEFARDDVRSHKQRLRSQPNNPLLLVDLARHYSSIGQNQRAKRYMEIALRFAPNHRFVLRAASRLYVHVDEIDRAHALLTNRARISADPWLLAAEISVATVADRRSKLIKQGQALLASRTFSADQTTELAAALGTVELGNGKTKVAAGLFRNSLERPNENALAQAEWAMRLHKVDLPVAERAQRVLKTYEADFWLRYQAKDVKAAKMCAQDWRYDEPFSARPTIMGQFTASLDEDYELAKTFSREGLLANPGHQQIIQNLIFAEAMTGNLNEAWSLLLRHAERGSVQSLANLGLIAYRSGNVEVGRKCYEISVLRAKRLKDPHFRAMAEANFAREAFLAKDPQAIQLINRAKEFLESVPHLVGAQMVWARTQRYLTGEAVPALTKNPVQNLPDSTMYLEALELK